MSGFIKCQCGGWKYYKSRSCKECRYPKSKPTKAELEALKPYCEGKNLIQIADALGLTYSAVDHRITRIKQRLNIYDRVLLTHWALKNQVARLQF